MNHTVLPFSYPVSRPEDRHFNIIRAHLPSPSPSQCEPLEQGLQSVDVSTPHPQPRYPPLFVPVSNHKRRRLSLSEVDGQHCSPLPDCWSTQSQAMFTPISSSNTEYLLSSLPQSTEVSGSQLSALATDSINSPSHQIFSLSSVVNDVQIVHGHDIDSQGEISDFSFDIPASVACTQSVDMQPVDFTFCNSPTLPSMLPFCDEGKFHTSLLFTDEIPPLIFLQVPSFNALAEPIGDHLSGLLSYPLDDDFLAPLLDTDQAETVPPIQTDDFSQIETGFGPSDINLVENVFSPPAPPLVDSEMTKRMIQLDSLWKQHRQLQARIQTLSVLSRWPLDFLVLI